VELGGHAAALALGHREDLVDQAAALLTGPGLGGALAGPRPLHPPEQDHAQRHGRPGHGQQTGPAPALGGAGGGVVGGRGGAQPIGQALEAGVDLGPADPVGGDQVAGGQQGQLGVEGGLPVGGGLGGGGGVGVAGEQGGQLGQGPGDRPAQGVRPLARGVVRDPAGGRPGLQHRLLEHPGLELEGQALGPLQAVDVVADPAGPDEGQAGHGQQPGGQHPQGRGPAAPPPAESSSPRRPRPLHRQPRPRLEPTDARHPRGSVAPGIFTA
jgi:hypothetical protein